MSRKLEPIFSGQPNENVGATLPIHPNIKADQATAAQRNTAKKVLEAFSLIWHNFLTNYLYSAEHLKTWQNPSHRLLERFRRSVWAFELWNLNSKTALLHFPFVPSSNSVKDSGSPRFIQTKAQRVQNLLFFQRQKKLK